MHLHHAFASVYLQVRGHTKHTQVLQGGTVWTPVRYISSAILLPPAAPTPTFDASFFHKYVMKILHHMLLLID